MKNIKNNHYELSDFDSQPRKQKIKRKKKKVLKKDVDVVD